MRSLYELTLESFTLAEHEVPRLLEAFSRDFRGLSVAIDSGGDVFRVSMGAGWVRLERGHHEASIEVVLEPPDLINLMLGRASLLEALTSGTLFVRGPLEPLERLWEAAERYGRLVAASKRQAELWRKFENGGR